MGGYTITFDWNLVPDGAYVFDYSFGRLTNFTFYSDKDIDDLGSIFNAIIGLNYNPSPNPQGGPRMWGDAAGTAFYTSDPNASIHIAGQTQGSGPGITQHANESVSLEEFLSSIKGLSYWDVVD
jgi:hypothetical protein